MAKQLKPEPIHFVLSDCHGHVIEYNDCSVMATTEGNEMRLKVESYGSRTTLMAGRTRQLETEVQSLRVQNAAMVERQSEMAALLIDQEKRTARLAAALHAAGVPKPLVELLESGL